MLTNISHFEAVTPPYPVPLGYPMTGQEPTSFRVTPIIAHNSPLLLVLLSYSPSTPSLPETLKAMIDVRPGRTRRKSNFVTCQAVTESPSSPLAHSLAREMQIAPDLARLIDAWPSLPEALKAGILPMIDAAKK